jgi:hypothetical protein
MSRRLGAQEVTVGTLDRIPPRDSHAEKEPPYQRSVVGLVFFEIGVREPTSQENPLG